MTKYLFISFVLLPLILPLNSSAYVKQGVEAYYTYTYYKKQDNGWKFDSTWKNIIGYDISSGYSGFYERINGRRYEMMRPSWLIDSTEDFCRSLPPESNGALESEVVNGKKITVCRYEKMENSRRKGTYWVSSEVPFDLLKAEWLETNASNVTGLLKMTWVFR